MCSVHIQPLHFLDLRAVSDCVVCCAAPQQDLILNCFCRAYLYSLQACSSALCKPFKLSNPASTLPMQYAQATLICLLCTHGICTPTPTLDWADAKGDTVCLLCSMCSNVCLLCVKSNNVCLLYVMSKNVCLLHRLEDDCSNDNLTYICYPGGYNRQSMKASHPCLIIVYHFSALQNFVSAVHARHPCVCVCCA